MRNTRIAVRVTRDEHAALKARARAHGVAIATYVRNVALNRRPDGDKAVDADAWWDALPPGRRASLHRWLTAPAVDAAHPGQTAIELPAGAA